MIKYNQSFTIEHAIEKCRDHYHRGTPLANQALAELEGIYKALIDAESIFIELSNSNSPDGIMADIWLANHTT